MSKVVRFADAAALAAGAADFFVRSAQEAIQAHGVFTVALSGGSTPRALYHLLTDQLAYPVDWPRVHVFWGDERFVPPDHPDSNYRMAHEALLAHVPVGAVHRIPSEPSPAAAAEAYEQTLGAYFSPSEGLDLTLLGLGQDGHTASLFPHTQALNEQSRRVVANEVPQLAAWRITLTASFINTSKQILFLVSGADKTEALRRVWGPSQANETPAQLIRPQHGRVWWYVDQTAWPDEIPTTL
jgi:6-phosphogluconolactonase